MRWCFDAGAHERADAVLRLLTSEEGGALVPVLWRYEVGSVLARAQLKGTISPEETALFLEDLGNMNIVVDAECESRILTEVYDLAIAHRLTVYDAAYLELVVRRNIPLATLDDDLIRACQTIGVTMAC